MQAVLCVVIAIFGCQMLAMANESTDFPCTEADNGKIYVHENTTLYKCNSGQLSKDCIVQFNATSYTCVDETTVNNKIREYSANPDFTSIMAQYYVDSEAQTGVKCDKLMRDFGNQMKKFRNKRDCTNGLERQANVDATTVQNIWCTVANQVQYKDANGALTCQNGVFA